MAERVMLGLGEFRFEIASAAYQKFSLNQSWRWPEQARINRDPALQFVGRNVGEIELDGVIYPSFKGGLGQIEAMRALADAGKPQQLVDGLGRIWGAWVITEIGDTRTVFADDGQPRKLEFRVKLKAYGEDDLGQATIKPAARAASAIASVTSVTEATAKLAALTAAAEALPDITPAMTPTALQSVVSATQGVVAEVTQTVADIASEVSGAINGAVAELRQAVLDAIPPQALQAVRDVQDAVGEIMALRQSVQATVAGVKNLPAALKRDVAGIDGALQLASFRIKFSGDVLRDTQTTLSTIARLGDAAAIRAQQAAADTAGSIVKSAEQINALCAKAQGCTGKIVEKWEGWHA
jgi:phage protein U